MTILEGTIRLEAERPVRNQMRVVIYTRQMMME
jgi:hypothetical protein